MSLVPLLFSDWWEDLDRPHHLLDQNFGLGLRPEQLLSPRRLEQLAPRRCPMIYYRPWADLMRENDGGVSTVQSDKDKFQVSNDLITIFIFTFIQPKSNKFVFPFLQLSSFSFLLSIFQVNKSE